MFKLNQIFQLWGRAFIRDKPLQSSHLALPYIQLNAPVTCAFSLDWTCRVVAACFPPTPTPKRWPAAVIALRCVYIYSWNAGPSFPSPFPPVTHSICRVRREHPFDTPASPPDPIKLGATITNQSIPSRRTYLFPVIWFPNSLSEWLSFHAFGSTKMYAHSATSFID